LNDIIFGVTSTKSIRGLRKEQLRAIEVVIIELKQKLILQRENKIVLEREDIKKLFDERYKLGCYNAIRLKKNVDLKMEWGIL